METLKAFIDKLLENPSEENKNLFLENLQKEEYNTLVEAEKKEYKSYEYFKARTKAFQLRPLIAMELVPKWVLKFGSQVGCPLQFKDTLNVPFREIKY
jgi:hypothetical protein